MNPNPIKVLIADDEIIIRRGLSTTVRWEKYNMQVVADVPNGKKGWEAFLEHKPDLIITDIVMPEMNGIEFAKMVKDQSPQTKILLLSCHRDFEYAQQGIKLGASGYLLKTAFNDEELEEYLANFQKEIQASQMVITDRELNTRKRDALLIEWLFGVSDAFQAELQKWLSHEWNWMNNPVYMYLVTGYGTQGQQKNQISTLPGQDEQNKLVCIPIGDDRCLLVCTESYKGKLSAGLSEMKASHPKMGWSNHGPITNPEAWLDAANKLHKHAELEKTYDLHLSEWPRPIAIAVEKIICNVQTSLCVSDVAYEVGLSRSHFSTLFKKVVGQSFVSYTYAAKLKIASELLLTTQLTIQDIADKVGIPDSKYFSKWFKRCTGETPSQYRHPNKRI